MEVAAALKTNPRAAAFVTGVLLLWLSPVVRPAESYAQATSDLGPVPENPFRAPLYWSVYEHHFLKEGTNDNYISEADLAANISWVEENLLPYGYDMIAMDGWGDVSQLNEHGYRLKHSRHWQNDYAWWAAHLESRGMKLGMYDNPLWVHMNAVQAGATVVGTNIPLSDIIDPNEESLWFTWVQVDREGAEEYVKGNIRHWADMGIRYLNADFLSWFEDGFDKNLGSVGPGDRPHDHYVTAMRWMKEAADENGMLFKAVMPHLRNEAEVELRYSHMIRINEDVGSGGWHRFSEDDRGRRRPWWSQWANPFDGYAYWSYLAGRDRMILCGDFIRLNTLDGDDEKKSVVSLHLMAGGPVGVSDQHDTIRDDLWIYQNEEMLALNHDGFVGRPLSNHPSDESSQIWTGQMSNGDWIVGLFNREAGPRTRSIDFERHLGISGYAVVRDLWQHAYIGTMEAFSAQIPPRGVRVLSVTPADPGRGAAPVFDPPAGTYSTAQSVTIETVTPDAAIFYTTDGTAPDAWSTAYAGPVQVSETTMLKAVATKPGLEDSDVSAATYTIAPLPSAWEHADIGSVTPAGSAAYADEVFTIRGSGADIEGQTDAFHIVYQPVVGDVTVTARVKSLTHTHAWAKAGVMIRETLDASAANAMTAVTASNGVTFQRRTASGGGTAANIASTVNAPHWVRVRRAGNTITGYHSADGTNWDRVGPEVVIDMASRVYAGLAVTSHNNGVLATADFSHVAAELTATDVEMNSGWNPDDFSLSQNYPNPFNPTTTIAFGLPEPAEVEIVVYDVLGRRVAVLASERYAPGHHHLHADFSQQASGLYYYEISAREGGALRFREMRSFVLAR